MLGLRHLWNWRPGKLAANAASGTTMLGLRLAAQAVYFLLLARLLGAQQFGMFSGIWVLCGFLATFAGLGFPVLVFRTMALFPASAPACAGRGLRVVCQTAMPLALLAILIPYIAFDERPGLAAICMIAVSEVVAVPVITLLSSLHQGNERLGRSHLMTASLWCARLAAVLAIGAVRPLDLQHVAEIHVGVTLLMTIAGLVIDRRHFLSPAIVANPDRAELLMGMSFAISGAAVIAFTELNQAILLAKAGAVSAGLLAVAYKFVAVSSAPLAALCQAVSPRLLRAASEGPDRLWSQGRALVFPVVGGAIACSCLIFAASHLIGSLFGAPYLPSEGLARALSVLPVFTGVRLLSVYLLMAASGQRVRVVAEVICLSLGLALNIILIAAYGLDGAIAAILITEISVALAMTWLAFRTTRRLRPQVSSKV